MSTGIHGHGTTLSLGGTTVGNVLSISGPDLTRDSIDVSTMDSTAKKREFLPGMIDSGEISVELQYDGTTVASLLAAQTTQTAQAVVITLPAEAGGATNTYTANGFITSLGHVIPFDDKITQTLTIKFTGALTYA